MYPKTRFRRLRKTENLRRLVRETQLSADQLIMPYFVSELIRGKEPISSMPGQFRFSIKALFPELEGLSQAGVRNIILFGIPRKKDENASGAYASKGIIQQAIRQIKKRFPGLNVITDVCLCEYMSHGHCGVVKNKYVQNDSSLKLLAKIALTHAEAGADMVAPSDMMDGRIDAIRRNLDRSGFEDLPIMSYAAKFASAYYGPFREAAHSAPSFGDRKSYQMNPANRREAMREIESDIKEGADIVMIKPALPYLDVIRDAGEKFKVPLAAYQVSGEYAMIKAATRAGFLDEKQLVLETLLSIRRAGANIILTYFAKDAARLLKK